MSIQYRTGDATQPETDGPAIIVHCCNDNGGWGRGFVVAISKRWREPETAYRALTERVLGAVELVPVTSTTGAPWWVANIIGQQAEL